MSFYIVKIATFISVYANWGFAMIKGMGWGWAGVIWLYNFVFYFPLDIIKFIIRYILSGKAWDLVIEQRVSLFPSHFEQFIYINFWSNVHDIL